MTQTTRPISPLGQRMLDDLRMRKLSDTTQSAYIRAVVNFTCFLGRSPDSATAEDLHRYQLHLVETGISRIRLNATITALRFFFGVTLERPEALAKMSTVREPRKLPVVLSRTEVARLITAPCCRSCLWARFHAQEGTVKPLSVQCKPHDRNYRRLSIQPLRLPLPQTQQSNPNSPAVVSRGFLP